MKFETKLTGHNVDIYGLADLIPSLKELAEGGDFDIENKDFAISWAVDIETRDWGISDVTYSVVSIGGTFDLVRYIGDTSQSEEIVFDFEPFKDSVTIELEFNETLQLFISGLEVDYSSKCIAIS